MVIYAHIYDYSYCAKMDKKIIDFFSVYLKFKLIRIEFGAFR